MAHHSAGRRRGDRGDAETQNPVGVRRLERGVTCLADLLPVSPPSQEDPMAFPADGVSRRDFINGMLVAAGGAAAGPLLPGGAEACVQTGVGVCDETDRLRPPRAARREPARGLQRRPLDARRAPDVLADSRCACGPAPAHHPWAIHDIVTDNGNYDVIVVGSGMSACPPPSTCSGGGPGRASCCSTGTARSAATPAATTPRPSPGSRPRAAPTPSTPTPTS